MLLVAFLLSGVGIGFAETAESTVVARGLPERLRQVQRVVRKINPGSEVELLGTLLPRVSERVGSPYSAPHPDLTAAPRGRA